MIEVPLYLAFEGGFPARLGRADQHEQPLPLCERFRSVGTVLLVIHKSMSLKNEPASVRFGDQGLGFGVSGVGFRVSGFGFRVSGFGLEGIGRCPKDGARVKSL